MLGEDATSYRRLISVGVTSRVSATKELSLRIITCLQPATLLNMDSFTCSFQRLFLFFKYTYFKEKLRSSVSEFCKKIYMQIWKTSNVKKLVSKLQNIMALKIPSYLLFFDSFYFQFFLDYFLQETVYNCYLVIIKKIFSNWKI